MIDKINNFINSRSFKRAFDIRNIILYIFTVIVIAITWSGIKTVQSNYELQKKISVLKQQNAVLALQNQNMALQNKFLETNEYLDLTARQSLGLAAPSEKVLTVPNSVAMKYVDPSLAPKSAQAGIVTTDNRSKYVKNLEDWRDFLLGRKLFENS